VLGRDVTREIFEGISFEGEILFYGLSALATIVFFVGIGVRLRKYVRGRRQDVIGSPLGFLRRAARSSVDTALNQTVAKRDPYAGVFHAAIMWGFIVLFIGTAILTIESDIVRPFLPQFSFYWGAFYVVYSLVLDILGLAMIVGIVAMAIRRARRPRQLDYGRVDIGPATTDRGGFRTGDWILLGWLGLLGVSGFILEGARILANDFPWFEVFSPVGWVVAGLFRALGLTAASAEAIRYTLWWSHAIVALALVGYFPFSKAIHAIVDPVNLALRSPLAGRRLPVLALAGAGAGAAPADGHIGIRDLSDLTWKQLVDVDACTKCGRCHVACPAVASGAPLSPRDLILDIRQEADAAWSILAPLGEHRSDRAYGGGTNGTGPADGSNGGSRLAGGGQRAADVAVPSRREEPRTAKEPVPTAPQKAGEQTGDYRAGTKETSAEGLMEYLKGASKNLAKPLEGSTVKKEGNTVEIAAGDEAVNFLKIRKEKIEELASEYFKSPVKVEISSRGAKEVKKKPDRLVNEAVRIFGGKVIQDTYRRTNV